MRTRLPLLSTIAIALVAVACSSGSDNSVTTTVAAATTSVAPPATSGSATTRTPATTATDASTTAGTDASVEDLAKAALLTPADVGPNFSAGTWTASDPAEPTPCGTPSVDSTVPAGVQVGAVIGVASTNQALQEEISVYNDEEEATQAFGVGTTGLSCSSGTVTFKDGTKAALTISAPADVTGDVGGDHATAWQLRGGGIQGVLVAVVLSGIVVTFQFTAPDTATDLQPAPLTVAKAGMDKILKS